MKKTGSHLHSAVRISYTVAGISRTSVQVGPTAEGYGTDCPALLQTYGTVCITPWKYEAQGAHSLSWWGTNANGSFLPNKAGINAIVWDGNFPQNVIIVYGTAPTITNERVTPALYNPAAGSPSVNSPSAGTQAITFTLGTFQSQPANITMRVVNQASVSTLRTITVPSQAAGAVTFNWDGRADNGMWVAPGYYTIILTVTDTVGNVLTQHLVTTIEY